jgi:hypothetical protein
MDEITMPIWRKASVTPDISRRRRGGMSLGAVMWQRIDARPGADARALLREAVRIAQSRRLIERAPDIWGEAMISPRRA